MKEVELAVIGVGPAGLSGAIESARKGVNVIVFDENKKAGGQLLSRIKLQTPVWRCSGRPKGSSSFFACSQKMPPSSCWGSFT